MISVGTIVRFTMKIVTSGRVTLYGVTIVYPVVGIANSWATKGSGGEGFLYHSVGCGRCSPVINV